MTDLYCTAWPEYLPIVNSQNKNSEAPGFALEIFFVYNVFSAIRNVYNKSLKQTFLVPERTKPYDKHIVDWGKFRQNKNKE